MAKGLRDVAEGLRDMAEGFANAGESGCDSMWCKKSEVRARRLPYWRRPAFFAPL